MYGIVLSCKFDFCENRAYAGNSRLMFAVAFLIFQRKKCRYRFNFWKYCSSVGNYANHIKPEWQSLKLSNTSI